MYRYEYDVLDRVKKLCYNNNVRCVVTYAYDALNQLIRENNPDTGKTYVYSYDTAGNILSAKTYAYTTGALGTPSSEDVYAYTDVNWGDKLTSYNGVSFTYDAQGNPLTYYNGENYTFTWQNGRQLASAAKGTTNVTYKYNSDGIRYEKTVNGVVHKYYLNGSTITAETIVNGDDVTYIEYFYDTLGAHSFSLNGTMYFYIKNLQGDVMHIATADNTIVASYTYDAWGNIESVTGALANTVGAINSIRYRGYYYDVETGLYYVSSRYYDAEIGRWINADSQLNVDAGTLGTNLFVYCLNDPVNQVDPLGTASYKNSYTFVKSANGEDYYSVTTTINIAWTKLTYKYRITASGIIRFDFDDNNYWSVLWRGAQKTLAEAMYKQAKAINKNFLYGRTIGGLNTELQGHWLAYVTTGIENARVADMGALTSGKIGYDSNAWFWEGGNAVKIICKISIYKPSIIRDILRYI